VKKIIVVFITISLLSFVGLVLFITNSTAHRPSTTIINEAVLHSMYAIGAADHETALNILLDTLSQEFEQTEQEIHSQHMAILLGRVPTTSNAHLLVDFPPLFGGFSLRTSSALPQNLLNWR